MEPKFRDLDAVTSYGLQSLKSCQYGIQAVQDLSNAILWGNLNRRGQEYVME